MRIVVNSGNIGNAVAAELARRGLEVVLATRTPSPAGEAGLPGVREVAFDPNDAATMERALEGADVFFSVTPLVENLVEAGTKAVRAAKAAGVRRIVRSSSLASRPKAAIRLGRWHHLVEEAIEASGIPFTVLRPTNFMQNYLRFGYPESVRGQGVVYSPLGAARVSMVDARDVSAVAVRVLTEAGHDGRRYELTGGEALSGDDVAGELSRALGKPVSHVTITESKAIQAMREAGLPPWMVEMLGELNIIGKSGHLAAVKPDAEALLGRKPTSFAEFVRDHLSAFRP